MSQNGKVRAIIIWLTVAITIVALAVFVITLVMHRGNPIWNRALITYCGVFWVFLAFDEIGRRAAVIGADSRRVPPRPRPKPQPDMPLPGLAGSSGLRQADRHTLPEGAALPTVHLERVNTDTRAQAEGMVNDCLREVLALDGKTLDPSGEDLGRHDDPDVYSRDVAAWLGDDSWFPFLIFASQEPVGVVAVARREGVHEIKILYILQEVRRQHMGSQAVSRVEEFVRLLGGGRLATRIGHSNMRAFRFYQSVGMAVEKDGAKFRSGQLATMEAEGANGEFLLYKDLTS